MILSIEDNTLNLQQSSTCKRLSQVGWDYVTIRDASWVSAEVAKALAVSEYKKYNTTRLERKASQPDEDFNRTVRLLGEKAKTQGGRKTNDN